MKFLVIGCGSIGRRHLRNLASIRAGELLAFDVEPAQLKKVRGIMPGIKASDDLGELWKQRPDACLVTVPTSFHVRYAVEAAKRGCHLFIEKPLSGNDRGLDKFSELVRKNRLVTFIGYNYRFNLCVLRIRNILKEKKLGRVISAHSHFGSYLPTRHPGEDYRKGYGARKSLGGGVILDALSHHFDLWCFLFGKPLEAVSAHGKHSGLELDVEDCADVLVRFSGGVTAGLHANFLERPVRNDLEIIGEEGTLRCDLVRSEVSLYEPRRNAWRVFKGDADYNDVYIREMKSFIRCVKRKEKPTVGLTDAKKELEMLLRIKESGAAKRWVAL